MSVRQSLGKVAVVPKGSWDGTKTYEFLDIVKSGGGSYIARQDVPIGIAITNTEYWVSLADKGGSGDDGVSPDVTVTEITGGHRVTITDKAHPHGQSFDVMDGASVEVDPTLTISGAAADAKVTGDEIGEVKSAIGNNKEWLRIYPSIVQGKRYNPNNGELVDDSSYTCASIPCSGGDHFKITAIFGTRYACALAVNAEGTTLAELGAELSSGVHTDYEIVTPEDTVEIRFSCATNASYYPYFLKLVTYQVALEIDYDRMLNFVSSGNELELYQWSIGYFNITTNVVDYRGTGNKRIVTTNAVLPYDCELSTSDWNGKICRYRMDGGTVAYCQANAVLTAGKYDFIEFYQNPAVQYDDPSWAVETFKLTMVESVYPDGLPAYYTESWLNERYNAIQAANSVYNGLSFAFFTDPHFKDNALNSKYLLNRVLKNTSVPFVICGGDFPPAYGTEAEVKDAEKVLLDYWNYLGNENLFVIRGNHDFTIKESESSRNGWTASVGETSNIICGRSERWTLGMNKRRMCFYLQNDSQKTRIVCINSCDHENAGANPWAVHYSISQEQINWILNTALSQDGYRYIFISHIPSDPAVEGYDASQAVVQAILEAVRNKSSLNFTGTDYLGSTITAVKDFTNTSRQIICHISGHAHTDDSHVENGVVSIATTCDALYQDDGYDATAGTVTEQAFDVFSFDWNNRLITANRIGRGNNRTWNYTI